MDVVVLGERGHRLGEGLGCSRRAPLRPMHRRRLRSLPRVRRPISRRKPQNTSSRSWPCNSRRSTSKSTSSPARNRKIANTSAVGHARRTGHSASVRRDSTASARGTGSTVSPSEYWHFQPFSTTRSRTACQSSTEASGTRRPAATPSSPGRRRNSRLPTADQPPRHAARLPDPTHPRFP